MKVSQGTGNRGNEHGWKKWQGGQGSHGTSFARSGTCEGVREQNIPQRDEGADGRNMTSSDCALREGSGRPTSAGKPARHRNTGGKVKYGVGCLPQECQETVAEQRDRGTKAQAESAETKRQHLSG